MLNDKNYLKEEKVNVKKIINDLIQSPKYALHPGYIYSKDDDKHYIGIGKLIELYSQGMGIEIKRSECISIKENEIDRYSLALLKTLIHLHPREDGNYTFYIKDELEEDPFEGDYVAQIIRILDV